MLGSSTNTDLISRLASSFELDPFFDLKCNFLSQETLIQSLFEAKKMKEVIFLVDYMIREGRNKNFLNIITQDLP